MGVEYQHFLVVNQAHWHPQMDTAVRVNRVLREWQIVDQLERVVSLALGAYGEQLALSVNQLPAHGAAFVYAGVTGAQVLRIAGDSAYPDTAPEDRYIMAVICERSSPYKTTVLNVCISCNTGWMSQLQNAAKPIVIRLADGEWPSFNEPECTLLARWATMVSINLQCHARMLAATQIQRTALMTGSMPSGWRVSIGSMRNIDCAGNAFHHPTGVKNLAIGDWEYLPIDSTYFCIEHAAFYTLSSLDDNTLQYGMRYGIGEVRLPTRPLWPFDFFADQSLGRDLVKSDLLGIQRQFGQPNQ